jgi:hypothetical protein
MVFGLKPHSQNRKPEIDACRSVSERATKTLAWEKTWPGAPILDFALHDLSLGRAALYRAILERSSFGDCHTSIDAALSGLRAAGTTHHLPRGLLTRAWLRALEGDRNGAIADLDEAWQVAERGSMKLHMADVHLYRARLFKDKAELEKARALIDSCGYGRRVEELEDTELASNSWGTP